MDVDGAMLASELRRRRVRHHGFLTSLGAVHRWTWVPGDLEATPTPLLVLAALSLTGGQHDGGRDEPGFTDGGPTGPRPSAGGRPRSRG